ncbi:MAG TPA: hypothetical protein PKY81_13155 [bacterium]|nr:hypothetical protein [bacterium]HPN31895.1 hypothetical protein [bacterium]
MDNLAVYIPIIIVAIIGFQVILRFINKSTLKKAVEKDYISKQQEIREAAARRAANKTVGGTKFKDKLNENPNEKKWDKMKTNPKMAKKRL